MIIAGPDLERASYEGVDLVLPRVLDAQKAEAAKRQAIKAQHAAGLFSEWMGPSGSSQNPTLVYLPRDIALSYARRPVIVSSSSTLSGVDDEFRSASVNVYHEIGHFWISSPRKPEDDWINEGVAEFLAWRATRVLEGEDVYQELIQQYRDYSLAQDMASFQNPKDESIRAKYFRPALMLTKVEDTYGKELMDKFLLHLHTSGRSYNSDQVAEFAGLHFGPDVGSLFLHCISAQGASPECTK